MRNSSDVDRITIVRTVQQTLATNGRTTYVIPVPDGYRMVSGGFHSPEEGATPLAIQWLGSFPTSEGWSFWYSTSADNMTLGFYLIVERVKAAEDVVSSTL